MSYDGTTARLKIKQVTAEDEGMYACEASNTLGKTTSTACLVVYGKFYQRKIFSFLPNFNLRAASHTPYFVNKKKGAW